MNRTKLFEYLKDQKANKLITLLQQCYHVMCTQQKREVFGDLEHEYSHHFGADAKILLREIRKFKKDSLRGVYYAPFDMNSKNYMNLPEETDRWFDKLAELLIESSQLTLQGEHIDAVKCFELLFECIHAMETDEGIVFAHDYGMWMLPIREEIYLEAYLKSTASLLNPEEYAKKVLSLMNNRNGTSINHMVYINVKRIASKNQKAAVDESIKQHKIKIDNHTVLT